MHQHRSQYRRRHLVVLQELSGVVGRKVLENKSSGLARV